MLDQFMCTGVSANWCPVHGNCTCRDHNDKNDDACPLHSEFSTHADPQGIQTVWGFVNFGIDALDDQRLALPRN